MRYYPCDSYSERSVTKLEFGTCSKSFSRDGSGFDPSREMNVLSWNCQGIGNSWTVDALKGLCALNHPDVIFLSETRCLRGELDSVRYQVGFKHMVVVDCKIGRNRLGHVTRSGGLGLFWKEEVHVALQSYSESHIDVLVGEPSDPGRWRFTGVYGKPKAEHRGQTWSLLRQLGVHNRWPWVIGGDFNEIVQADEKEGGPLRCGRQ